MRKAVRWRAGIWIVGVALCADAALALPAAASGLGLPATIALVTPVVRPPLLPSPWRPRRDHSTQSTPQPAYRRGRRVLIGALVGAAVAAPVARLAHQRFENEAASGTGIAVTTVALGAGIGAFIGLATCS